MNQEKNEYLDENFYDPSTGEMCDFKTFIKAITYEDSAFHEIFRLYLDYCKYMVMDKYSDEELETSLDFLINKALSSTYGEIRKIGETLLNYYYEILNLFTSKNKFKFTNGVAEALNNNIDKLLGVSYGLKSFKILKKKNLMDAN